MEEFPTFEVKVGGHDLSLEIGRCAIALFREQSEVDYLAVDLDEDSVLRIFNNPEFVHWLAGYRIEKVGDNWDRPQVLNFRDSPDSFRELVGWNPAVIERDKPNDAEMEMFLDVNLTRLDDEWRELG